MRTVIAFLAGLLVCGVRAQTGWMPLSREVERPYAHAMERWGSEMHTAIRPFRSSEVRALDRNDSLRPVALLAVLDRWAGARNGRTFRWGPLMDASVVYDAGQDDAVKYRAGGGLWTDLDVGTKLNFHLFWYANVSWQFHWPTGAYWSGRLRIKRKGYSDLTTPVLRRWDGEYSVRVPDIRLVPLSTKE